jgi:biopolymer transport protein ExbD
MARRTRRYSSLRAKSDIDITPLMDLTFLLLIVFMITAPMLEYGVDVSPPELDAEVIDDDSTLILTLDRNGHLEFDGETVEQVEIEPRLRLVARARPEVAVLIRADEGRAYGEVMGIMKAVKNAGISNVSLITQAEERR